MAEAAPGRRLPPVVRALGAVSLCNDLASEMVYPLLPHLVTRGLGSGALALGALDGISEGLSALVKLGAGRLGDRAGRRGPLVVGGYLVAALARAVMGLAGVAWQVVALRVVDRVGKGVRTPPRDAVIADAVPHDLRGRAFGYHRAMDHAGAVIGPLVAALLIAAFALPPERVVLWSLMPGLLAVAVAVYALRRAAHGAGVAPSGAANGGRGLGGAPLVAAVAFAGVRLPETLLMLRLLDLGVAAGLVPVLWAALHAIRAAGSYPGGWLSDRVGPVRTMAFGWIAYAAVAAALAVARDGVLAGGAFLAFGIVAPTTEPPERAAVAGWAGPARRGRGFGVYHAAAGAATLAGGLGLGALYQSWGGPTALAASATAAALIAMLGLGLARSTRA
jgi:MFS family permease